MHSLFDVISALHNMNDFSILRFDFEDFFNTVSSEYVFNKYISKISLRTLDRRIECIKNKKEKIVKNKEKQEGNYGRSTY